MKTHRCVVWWASLDKLSAGHHELLSDVERSRWEKLLRQEDKDRSALGAALLRLAVSEATGAKPADVNVHRKCPTCGGPHGKPSIPDTDLHVSVTHSGQWAGVVVTTAGPVGIDVEQISHRFEVQKLLRVVLSEGESIAKDDEFFTIWARKEAVLKATGDGLRESMTGLTMSPASTTPKLLAAHKPELPALTQLHDLVLAEGYAAAIAVLSNEPLLIEQRHL